ncbi:unnamed protein product, partial [Brugia timori]|uniref:Ovule protein n=1 Tax=Brugia timori TaxID=42155 RepID=A0A0R3QHU9_9BILA
MCEMVHTVGNGLGVLGNSKSKQEGSLLSMEEIEPYVRRKRMNSGKSNKLQGLNEE